MGEKKEWKRERRNKVKKLEMIEVGMLKLPKFLSSAPHMALKRAEFLTGEQRRRQERFPADEGDVHG